jgi:hypothetical protein
MLASTAQIDSKYAQSLQVAAKVRQVCSLQPIQRLRSIQTASESVTYMQRLVIT